MAAQNGVFRFVGLMRRITYDVSAYFDDTATNPVRFDTSGKAGSTSPTEWIPMEPVMLVDMVLAAATGQTTTQLNRNNVPTGDYLLNALHLAAITTRPGLRVPCSAGIKFGAKQLA